MHGILDNECESDIMKSRVNEQIKIRKLRGIMDDIGSVIFYRRSARLLHFLVMF